MLKKAAMVNTVIDMDEAELNKLIENNRKISKLFAENEKILRDIGYQPPVQNYSTKNKDRISIPSGYIRTSATFWQEYHLNEIVNARNTKNNISYALQLSDFYNFLINRFNIWGSIEIMLYKQAFVNIVSIIEALILECANNINAFCKKCSMQGKCGNNIGKYDRENMKKAVEKLRRIGIIRITNEEQAEILDLYDLRNKVHIRLNVQNEFLDNKYNNELYNKAIVILKKVDEQIWKNGVPRYSSCMGFVEKENPCQKN